MKRYAAAAVIGLGLSVPALAQQSLPPANPELLESVDPDQRRITEEIIRQYILKHPEIVVEAIRILQEREQVQAEKQAREALAANATTLRHDPHSPVGGNPEGDVTVVEFFDYACPYCRRAHPVIGELAASDQGVRIVYKEFPILGEDSVFAARVGIAIFLLNPDKYLPYHETMLTARGRVSPQKALQVANQVGIDSTRLLQAMETEEVTQILNRNVQLAQAIGVEGTPGFVIGDAVVPGLVSVDQFLELVKQARESCQTCEVSKP